MEKLVIYGSGGQAKVVAAAVHDEGRYEVVAFLDDDASRHGESLYGLPILSPDLATGAGAKATAYICAIGSNGLRLEKSRGLQASGLEPATVIHPTAHVATGARLGPGTVLLPRAVVHCDASLGRDVIVNTGAIVEHDCELSDGVHLAPGVTLAGRVSVGQRVLVGVGATVLPGLKIGEDAIIGGGAVVVNDVPGGAVARGNPAR